MIDWYETTVRPRYPENSNWEAERTWAIKTGFTRDAYIGHEPYDLPNLIKGKRRRTVNGVDLPVALDHLRIYRNPKTNKRIAIFHEYPASAAIKQPILLDWCEKNGLEFTKMDYSWYLPGITVAYMISAEQK